MSDPHRRPAGKDRDALVARIDRAAAQGQIGPTDRDIRLRNVAAAQSMAELDLIGRDLDQLEASVPAGPAAAGSSGRPESEPADGLTDQVRHVATGAGRAVLVVAVVAVLIGLVVVGAVGLVRVGSSSGSSTSSDGLLDPVPVVPSEGEPTGPDDAGPGTAPAGASYSLTGPGIRAFLALYRQRFSTSEVVDLTMYGDDVVVDVPEPGTNRHSGWLYRPREGFMRFGGVTANFPGARPVDTNRLAVRALVRNIATARSGLGVQDPTTTYVIVRHYPSADGQPRVDIHVANDVGESGYLATGLGGEVERSYPSAG